ncbi:MAG: alpha/beta hydrolase, partial [Actinomycetota bacterium]
MSDDMAAPRTERLPLTTGDGLDLRAELAAPADPRAVAVVCHPHPLHGGNMYANVVETLFQALPATGVATLRFNFRGTNGSEGRHDQGRGEQLDVVAGIETVSERHPGLPLLLAGYSFGADLALAVDHGN